MGHTKEYGEELENRHLDDGVHKGCILRGGSASGVV